MTTRKFRFGSFPVIHSTFLAVLFLFKLVIHSGFMDSQQRINLHDSVFITCTKNHLNTTEPLQ